MSISYDIYIKNKHIIYINIRYIIRIKNKFLLAKLVLSHTMLMHKINQIIYFLLLF